MNPHTRLDDLLESSGAVQVRNGKHLIFRLPGGKSFTKAKTPSDHRAIFNQLSDLKRTLRTTAAAPTPRPLVAVQPQNTTAEPPTAAFPEAPPIEVTYPSTPHTPLAIRINELIAAGEIEQDELMERAEVISKQLALLREVQKHSDAPYAEALLTILLGREIAEEPIVAAAPPPPPPPPAVKYEITKAKVSEALRERPIGNFTVHDIYNRLVNGDAVDREEGLRIRRTIASSLISIHQRGEQPISRVTKGQGRGLGIWAKQDPATIGRRIAIEAIRAEEAQAEEANQDINIDM